jgi:hypothetical protein
MIVASTSTSRVASEFKQVGWLLKNGVIPARQPIPQSRSTTLSSRWYQTQIVFPINLSLGYNNVMMEVSKAASIMGRKSVKTREKKWGKKEFVRRMQEWGKLGGRPKGSSKKKKRAR